MLLFAIPNEFFDVCLGVKEAVWSVLSYSQETLALGGYADPNAMLTFSVR